ncbi:hypothetical protein HDU96_002090 [Phlyctochytrium bullatum]|nr:hypothetical protein HDU96_002090 [Phlyctochytrium bullatum]
MRASSPTSGPVVVMQYSPDTHEVHIREPTGAQCRWTASELLADCRLVILQAFRDSGAAPDRLVYALAGRVFNTTSPLPYGGKKRPGFHAFRGTTADDVLVWILEKAVECPKRGRGRRGILPPGGALRYVAREVNHLLGLQRGNGKDLIDDMVLRGLTRTGHRQTYPGQRTLVPSHLRAVMPEAAAAIRTVEFTKRAWLTLNINGRPVVPVVREPARKGSVASAASTTPVSKEMMFPEALELSPLKDDAEIEREARPDGSNAASDEDKEEDDEEEEEGEDELDDEDASPRRSRSPQRKERPKKLKTTRKPATRPGAVDNSAEELNDSKLDLRDGEGRRKDRPSPQPPSDHDPRATAPPSQAIACNCDDPTCPTTRSARAATIPSVVASHGTPPTRAPDDDDDNQRMEQELQLTEREKLQRRAFIRGEGGGEGGWGAMSATGPMPMTGYPGDAWRGGMGAGQKRSWDEMAMRAWWQPPWGGGGAEAGQWGSATVGSPVVGTLGQRVAPAEREAWMEGAYSREEGQ